MTVLYGYDGVKHEITHLTLPDGTELEELSGHKTNFEDAMQICKLLEKSYNAGVVAEREII